MTSPPARTCSATAACTSLSERGIDLNLGYTGEAAHNFSGGKDKLTRTDQWVFGATLNLDKLWGCAAAPSR